MALLNRLWTHFSGDTKQLHKQADALIIGILGAANICNMALLNPASKLPNVLIYGIAARDRQKAEAFARKHYIPKVYDNYDQLLADPDITMIYNPLPNGLHYEWTMKALRLGKHVLCEKPLANNAEEVREMVEEAKRQNPRFFKNDDIRFQYSLGGGAQMDIGCYLVSMCRFIVNTYNNRTEQNEGSFEIQKAEPLRVSSTNPQIDHGMRSEFKLDGIQCNIHNEFTNDWSFFKQQIIIECERATITIAYLIAPVFYHYLTIRQRDNGQTRTIKNYADNQSTYYYQLRACIEAIRCFEKEDSIDKAYEIAYTTGTSGIHNMKIIDEIYRKAGLVVRGTKI
ncbi:hypothetical protein I4U23_008070 [Adineta vaga]|nr:hypothetical protein I4U23_008070 [Adineta vaga]